MLIRKQWVPELEVARFKLDTKADAVRIKGYGDETYFLYQGNDYAFSDQGNLDNTTNIMTGMLSTFKFTK